MTAPESADQTAADVIARTLVAAGVQTVYGLPGEENLAVVEALAAHHVELVVCRHEQHAAFMAVAHARLTGDLAVSASLFHYVLRHTDDAAMLAWSTGGGRELEALRQRRQGEAPGVARGADAVDQEERGAGALHAVGAVDGVGHGVTPQL